MEHRHFRLVFLPALLAMAAGSAATARMTATPAQQVATPTAPATGVITGTVVDGDSGAPIGGAVVQLNTRVAIGAGRGGAVNDQLMTTPDGRFLLRGLPKGPYVLTVRKPGYMNGVPGRRSPRSTSTQAIELTDGQRITNLSISMWKYASIIGTIVDETGEPFVGATVKACLRVEQAGRMKFDFVNPDASAITDDRGVFRQNNLLPGDYVIVVASASATMPASVQDLYNQALRDGRETELNREINATTALLPTLSGMRVGDSVVGFGRTAMGSEGTFRRPGPGELPAAGGKILIYRTTFYPGTFRAADAGIVTLKAGEERSGINIQLRPVVSTRISGTLIGPDGPQVNMGLRLIPTDTLEDFTNEGGMMNSVTITDAQGAFTFLGIPPAQYTLLAIRQPPMPPVDPNGGPQLPVFQRPAPSEPTLWARVPLSVGEQGLDNVVVSLQRGSRVSGRVEFSGTTSPPPPNRLPQIRVDMSPADGSGAEIMGVLGHNTPVIGRVATDGTFRTYGLPAGKYVAIVDAIPGWFVRSVMLQGRDISSSPLELRDADLDGVVITLTDRPATVTGTVRNGQGVADMTATVLIFPTERTAWVDLGWRPRRVQSTRAGLDSAFTFADVAAGEYFVVAIPDERTANWRDAKFLESLVPSATRIRVDDSGTVRQELTTIRVR